MNTRMYRLPVGVDCLSNQGKVRISGPCGVVVFDSSSKLYRKGNILIFLPELTKYYSSIFTQAVLGVVLGYTIELNLKGIGYRVSKEKGELILHLGYSHSIILEIPKEITVTLDKKIFSLMSANYGLLQNFATKIRSYRLPDSYKGAGVLYNNEIVNCKQGKKN
uniref:Ribosomal protein L6 n=1 Tax=Fucus spiralis TaxID=87149 RepID=A0A2R4QQ34_9PHAE|nr:ribosomal protein L6 [Fucus spiralis]